MASQILVTWQDVALSLLDWAGVDTTDAQMVRKANSAILAAYRHVPTVRNWSYYQQRRSFATEAPQSSSTITYDHCVTPEHEALTRNGWKTFDQLSVGDEILAYDHDSEMCSWQPIQKLHAFKYDGKILDVKRKGRSVLRCTPNHRIPVYERYGHGHGTPRKLRKKWVLAKDLTPEQTTPFAAPINEESAGPLDPRIVSLLSWCVTDGYATFKKWGTPRIIQSPTANPVECAEIAVLTTTRPYRTKEGCHSYPVYKHDARKFKAVANSKDDLIPLFCRFGVQQSEAAIRAMLLAEASTNKSNEQKVFTQWGDNKPVAEAFQIACLLAGKATNITEGKFRCKSFGKDYGIRPRYQCPVRHSKGIKLAKLSKWVSYKGTVWCPQVRTGGWVVRCNGAVMITGNSGGASERMATIASGTWPTNAARGWIRISGHSYKVQTRESSTIITLSVNSNPGTDVAAGTSYQWYRDTYPLPLDFQSMGRLRDINTGDVLEDCTLDTLLYDRWCSDTAGRPQGFSIVNDPDYIGSMAVVVTPAPDAAYTYDYPMQRRPRDLNVRQYNTGTASTSSTTVSGSSDVTFTAKMVGSVIRFSSDGTNAPTSPVGTNPAVESRIITAYSNATTLTMDAALTATATSDKYEISDPIDIEQGAMFNAFLRYAEYQMSIQLRREPKEIAGALGVYEMELRQALAADSRHWPDPSGVLGRSLIGTVSIQE